MYIVVAIYWSSLFTENCTFVITAYTFIKTENLYTHEIPSSHLNSTDFPIKNIKPLLEISYNNFRGEKDLAQATLLFDNFENLGFENSTLLEILIGKQNYPLKAFCWQNAYTSQSGRRRYKPTSEGFTLKIKKRILKDYLNKNDMELCYDVSLRRSANQYGPEDYVNWNDKRERIVISF